MEEELSELVYVECRGNIWVIEKVRLVIYIYLEGKAAGISTRTKTKAKYARRIQQRLAMFKPPHIEAGLANRDVFLPIPLKGAAKPPGR
jgi:hypothetical protein